MGIRNCKIDIIKLVQKRIKQQLISDIQRFPQLKDPLSQEAKFALPRASQILDERLRRYCDMVLEGSQQIQAHRANFPTQIERKIINRKYNIGAKIDHLYESTLVIPEDLKTNRNRVWDFDNQELILTPLCVQVNVTNYAFNQELNYGSLLYYADCSERQIFFKEEDFKILPILANKYRKLNNLPANYIVWASQLGKMSYYEKHGKWPSSPTNKFSFPRGNFIHNVVESSFKDLAKEVMKYAVYEIRK